MRFFATASFLAILACGQSFLSQPANADEPLLVLHNGKILTVDSKSSIYEAMLVRGDKIVQLGTDAEILKAAGSGAKSIDLAGKTVIPGLIDSHVHPNSACVVEFDHEIPELHTIAEVLDHIRARAKELGPGKWIMLRQVFITRLKDQRFPTLAELDAAAPKNPVLFETGPDAMLSSLALKESGIDKNFVPSGNGYIEKDPQTGEPTGILRSCTRYAKAVNPAKQPTEADHVALLKKLFHDYNANGITGIGDRDASDSDVDRYRLLDKTHELTVRAAISVHVDTDGSLDSIRERIHKIAADPMVHGDDFARIIGVKTYLDGGMLTGSAYMTEPWGVSKIYSITDPHYRGLLYIPKERLLPIVKETLESDLQFTAHSVGSGAVQTLLEVYSELSPKLPLHKYQACITHSNFMSQKSIDEAARLGVVLDIQPAWLYLDTRTLAKQFGYDRLRYFQPLHSLFEKGVIVGGGSDHMQKIGAMRAVNPYHVFLGMWTEITRRANDYEGQLHPEEALTRAEALKFYTWNNAFLEGREKSIGSLEPGKLADFVILDRDPLTCDLDKLVDTKVLSTYLGGKVVYSAPYQGDGPQPKPNR